MKKIKIFLAALTAALMCGCAASSVTFESGMLSLNEPAFTAQIPEGWSVLTGDDIYEDILSRYPNVYDSAATVKEELLKEGLTHLVTAYSADSTSMLSASVQDMTDSVQQSLEEYAQSVHDTTIFSYQAGGYKIRDGNFSAQSYGGKDGFLSHFELMTPDDEPTLISGFYEFLFSSGEDVCSVQVMYSKPEGKAEALAIIESIAAK